VRIPLAFAAVVLGACSAAPAPTPAPTPAPASAPPVATTPAPASTAGAAPTAAAPQEVPRFLSLESDPEKEYPLRAVLRRNGPAYEERGGPVANDADGRSMRLVVPVLDPDEGNATPQPRVLCDELRARIALYLTTESLATVALGGALLVPAPPLPASITPQTPGVHFQPGAELLPLGPASPDGTRKVRYNALLLRAEGIVEAAKTGYVYRPADEPVDDRYDAELPRGARFLDAPNGALIATLSPYPNPLQKHVARTLGPQKAGFVLLALAQDAAVLVGWVAQKDVVKLPKLQGGGGGGFGFGSGSGTPSSPVKLPRGTLLLSEGKREPIGVVTQEHQAECTLGCDGQAPKVKTRACGSAVRVWAKRPEEPR
jgi:hypothetical protein